MRPGLAIALAAIGAQLPRLGLALVTADGLEPSPVWRAALLWISAGGAAIVLTGGAAYLAHRLYDADGALRRVLGIAWCLILLSLAVLVCPLVVAHLAHDTLAGTLEAGPAARPALWIWAAVSVLALEVALAAAVLADGAGLSRARELAELRDELEQVARARNLAQLRLDKELARRAAPAPIAGARRSAPPPAAAPQGLVTDCRNGCGATFSSRRAEAGHQRACAAKVVAR